MLEIRLKSKAYNIIGIYRVHRQTPYKHEGEMDVAKHRVNQIGRLTVFEYHIV